MVVRVRKMRENVGSEAGVRVIYFAAKENMADEIN